MFPDGWTDSLVAVIVVVTIAVVCLVNMVMVLTIVLRRTSRSMSRRYVRSRERFFSDTVFGTLIVPPDRDAFRLRGSGRRSRSHRGDKLGFPDRMIALRPGDSWILEQMFLRLAVEVRGTDRETMTAICEDAGFVDRHLSRLTSRFWWRRLAAAQKLGVMRSRRATDRLADSLNDTDREVRLASLRALGEIGDPKSYDRLLAAMEEVTRWEPMLIAEVVLQVGSAMTDPILSRMQATNDETLKTGYVRLLGLLRESSTVASLLPLLAVDHPSLRLETVRALGEIGDSRVTSSLLPYLDDSNAEVRAATVEALGRIGDDHNDVVRLLRQRLADVNRPVRYEAALALATSGPAGHSLLEDAARDNDPLVQIIALQILAEETMGLR